LETASARGAELIDSRLKAHRERLEETTPVALVGQRGQQTYTQSGFDREGEFLLYTWERTLTVAPTARQGLVNGRRQETTVWWF